MNINSKEIRGNSFGQILWAKFTQRFIITFYSFFSKIFKSFVDSVTVFINHY